MTVQELINKLNKIENKNAVIYTGCQGYTNYDDPKDEYKINVYKTKDKGILICDQCYYECTYMKP